jgi:hypothetical protein
LWSAPQLRQHATAKDLLSVLNKEGGNSGGRNATRNSQCNYGTRRGSSHKIEALMNRLTQAFSDFSKVNGLKDAANATATKAQYIKSHNQYASN